LIKLRVTSVDGVLVKLLQVIDVGSSPTLDRYITKPEKL